MIAKKAIKAFFVLVLSKTKKINFFSNIEQIVRIIQDFEFLLEESNKMHFLKYCKSYLVALFKHQNICLKTHYVSIEKIICRLEKWLSAKTDKNSFVVSVKKKILFQGIGSKLEYVRVLLLAFLQKNNFVDLSEADRCFVDSDKFFDKYSISGSLQDLKKENLMCGRMFLRPMNTIFIDVLNRKNNYQQYFDSPIWSFYNFGTVFRRDRKDATHSPDFHQIDVCRISYSADRIISKQCLVVFLKRFISVFWKGKFRFRTHFFPYTLFSFEVDLKCDCGLRKCKLCDKGWVEILGCGTVHPKFFRKFKIPYASGWAFGIGLERLSMFLFNCSNIEQVC